MENLFRLLNLGNAAVYSGLKSHSNILKIIGTSYFFAYYFFNSKQANIEVKKFSVNPSFEVAKTMWNLLDTNGIKQLYVKALPGIKYRKKLYFKKTQKVITKDYISELIEKIKTKQVLSMNDRGYMNSLNSHYADESISNFSSKEFEGELLKTKLGKNEINDYVKVKLLHSRDLYIDKLRSFSLFDCCINKVNFTRDSLIIHIHGGGWVAMSSSSHENYLRQWTKGLEVPIISIDYRLAPDNPYPNQLDDVWQAYNWIIRYATEELGIELNKIVLVGDSAGGNLALALTYLLILTNKRAPDSLVLAYPGCRVDLDFFYPSYLLTLQDKVLPYHFIQYCLASYTSDYKRVDDPFLSPIIMDDIILKQMPPVIIVSGSSDPLRDDIVAYVDRLTQLDKECKLYEFKYFPHGFLNYDVPMMMPEAKVGVELMMREIEKVINPINKIPLR